VFANRRDAGRQLAERLLTLGFDRPVVVALPRGGVPVGFELARALAAPLDVLVVRKLGAPRNPELGVGAIAEGGAAVFDAPAAARVGMSQAGLDATVARERGELLRRVARYRQGRDRIDLRGRDAIVVDDGLATGLTALAAVRAMRAAAASRVVVAVPVGARESVALVAREADEVVCQTIPARLLAVGHFYLDFAPVSDEEVIALLAGGGELDTTSG
jgi:putative phosphoribosyl transferase